MNWKSMTPERLDACAQADPWSALKYASALLTPERLDACAQAEERAAMEAEQERIRIEQEARAAELAKQERELREAREKIEREEAEKAEAARIEAERIENEEIAARLKKERDAAVAAELARIEAQRPDMERASRWFVAQLAVLLDSESPAIADADVLARFGADREILESAFRAVAARWAA